MKHLGIKDNKTSGEENLKILLCKKGVLLFILNAKWAQTSSACLYLKDILECCLPKKIF